MDTEFAPSQNNDLSDLAGPSEDGTVKAMERNNLILVVLGTLASVYLRDRAWTLSFLAGGLLTIFNLRLLRVIVGALTGSQKVSRKKLTVQILVKFVGGLGLLAALILWLKVDPLALILGLSTIVVAIFIEAFKGLWRRT